jgi:DNA-binding PadR family transcriptional regulator
MKLLSRSEEIILIAILKLGDDAYGAAIRRRLKQDTGAEWSFGSIYTALNTLTRRGYVKKRRGEPTAERGGRHKCLYKITAAGKEALREIRRIQRRVWMDIPDIALD